jgi:hypothetical protein
MGQDLTRLSLIVDQDPKPGSGSPACRFREVPGETLRTCGI